MVSVLVSRILPDDGMGDRKIRVGIMRFFLWRGLRLFY